MKKTKIIPLEVIDSLDINTNTPQLDKFEVLRNQMSIVEKSDTVELETSEIEKNAMSIVRNLRTLNEQYNTMMLSRHGLEQIWTNAMLLQQLIESILVEIKNMQKKLNKMIDGDLQANDAILISTINEMVKDKRKELVDIIKAHSDIITKLDRPPSGSKIAIGLFNGSPGQGKVKKDKYINVKQTKSTGNLTSANKTNTVDSELNVFND